MNIAVWYHCKVSGEGIPDRGTAIVIVQEQMDALKKSGLAVAANEIHVGINGPDKDVIAVGRMAPDQALIYRHGPTARFEFPTLHLLRQWCFTHRDWAVLYHHSKGVTQPTDLPHHHHRRVMEKACVWDWQQCVRDLERGYDAVGINLVDPITRPVLPGRFFAGNFWWANSRYLLTLPDIPDHITSFADGQRCIAEMWIGRSKTRPALKDYERPELSHWCVATGKVKP